MKLLTISGVAEKLGIKSISTIKKIIRSDDFPRPIDLPFTKKSKWLEEEIDQWIKNFPKKGAKQA